MSVRWEYLEIHANPTTRVWVENGEDTELRDDSAEMLNRKGREAWELVAVLGKESSPRYYLKRPVSVR